MRLLVIEDDDRLRRLLRAWLREEGHVVDEASDADSAFDAVISAPPDVVLLDLGLPGEGGISLLRRLRRSGCEAVVIVLTGRADDGSVVLALDSGADDYLVKPVSSEVLKARVRAALRRGGHVPSGQLTCGALAMDRRARRVMLGDLLVPLPPREYALLEHFLMHPGQVLTRSTLLEQVWQDPGVMDSNVVDARIASLRRRIAAARAPGAPTLRTIRGAGYVLEPPAAAAD